MPALARSSPYIQKMRARMRNKDVRPQCTLNFMIVEMSATAAAVRERLSRWDTLAPLSDRQKECFLELSSTAANRPLPLHVNI